MDSCQAPQKQVRPIQLSCRRIVRSELCRRAGLTQCAACSDMLNTWFNEEKGGWILIFQMNVKEGHEQGLAERQCKCACGRLVPEASAHHCERHKE